MRHFGRLSKLAGVMIMLGDGKWRIVNGISCRKCAEFFPEEMGPYKREFQYQGCKLCSLLNSMGYQTINIHICIYLFMLDRSHFIRHLKIIQIYFNFVFSLFADCIPWCIPWCIPYHTRSDACLLYLARPHYS